jgi:hypothetical protein
VSSVACVAILALVGIVYYFQSRPVRVLNINEAGQVQSFLLRLSGFTLNKSETQAALRNSLSTWAEGFYSRIRTPQNGEVATLAYPKSFIFLSSTLSQIFSQREATRHEIAGFASNADPEYRVAVTNVIFRNLEKKPYDADIYFDRLYYSTPLTVLNRKSYFVPVQFLANPSDEEIETLKKRSSLDIDTLMRMNPLVVAITHIGDESSFTPAFSPQQ